MSLVSSDQPTISVCIPVFNGQNYLEEALRSVLAQSYKDFEVIIIDNFSTDKTKQIAQKYVRKDKRVHYMCNAQNIGLVRNWNKALLLARGEYIKVLCHDDILYPDHLAEFIQVLIKNPDVVLVTSFEQLIGDLHQVRKIPEIPCAGKLEGKVAQRSILLNGNWIGSPSSVLFRKSDLSIGLFNIIYSVWLLDLEMWLRLLSVGNLYVIPKILTSNRVHPHRGTATGNSNFRHRKEELHLLREVVSKPEIYGNFSAKDYERALTQKLTWLINEGLDRKNLTKTKQMIAVGRMYGGGLFYRQMLKTILEITIQRPKLQNFSLKLRYFWRSQSLVNKVFFYPHHFQTKKQEININWSTVHTGGFVQLPLAALKVPLYTDTGLKIVPLSQTPHFEWAKAFVSQKSLKKTEKEYWKYVDRFSPEIDATHQLKKISNFFQKYFHQIDKIKAPIVIYFPDQLSFFKQEYIIYDGVHRAALFLATGQKKISCAVMLEVKPNEV